MVCRLLYPLAAALVLAGCVGGPPTASAERQICREHNKDNPTELDRCNLNPDLRHGAPPQARPQDLPVRTGDGSGL